MYQIRDHIRYVCGRLSGCLQSVQLCHQYRGLWWDKYITNIQWNSNNIGCLKLIRSIYMYLHLKISTIYQLGLYLNIYIQVYLCSLQTEWNVYCYKLAHKCGNQFLSWKRCVLVTVIYKFYKMWILFHILLWHGQCTLKFQCRSITYIQQMYQIRYHSRYVCGQLSGCLHSVQHCHQYRGLW